VARPLSKRFHADRKERVVGRPQLIAGIDAPALAPRPFAVKEVSPG
jgi:hypothetical protein